MEDFSRLDLPGLRCTLEGPAAWIRLERPPANALDLALIEGLTVAIRAARFDPRARVVVLGSAVPGYFSAGLDVTEMEQASPLRAELLDHLFKDLIVRSIRTARKVFIAVIEGHCLGGGLELALAADMRLGVAGPWKTGLPEVRLGGMPGGGGMQMLARLVGRQRAQALVMAGATLDPAAAHEAGLLDVLIPADQPDQTAGHIQRLAEGPLEALAAIKLAFREGLELHPDAALLLERELYARLYETDDLREGMAAFREKRPPKFGADSTD